MSLNFQLDRNDLLSTYSALQESLAAAKTELVRYQSSNAGQYDEKRRALILAKEATIRWNGLFPSCGGLADLHAFRITDSKSDFDLVDQFQTT